MKVLVLSHMFPSPAEPVRGLFVLEQLRALRGLGVEATTIAPRPWPKPVVAALKGKTIPDAAIMDGFSVEYPGVLSLPSGMLFWSYGWSYYLSLRKRVPKYIKNGVQLIHAHTIMPDGFAAVLLSHKFGIPVVCTIHGSDISIYPHRSSATRIATCWALHRLTHIIAVSHDLKRKIAALSTIQDVEVVPNGADTTMFSPIPQRLARAELSLPLDASIVLYVGNLVPVKGVEYLISAMSRLHNRDARLYVVGGGYLRAALVEAARRENVLDRCIFMGPRKHDQIPLWLSAADCLALPSLSEGLPTILAEAMLCRTPVVATAVGGVPEIVEDQVTGHLVPARDPARLAEAIDHTLDRPDELGTMLDRAHSYANRQLTWRANAEKTRAVYEQAIRQ